MDDAELKTLQGMAELMKEQGAAMTVAPRLFIVAATALTRQLERVIALERALADMTRKCEAATGLLAEVQEKVSPDEGEKRGPSH